jgi:hypothetical protein
MLIRWPSGHSQTIERPQIDRLHRIQEPSNANHNRT